MTGPNQKPRPPSDRVALASLLKAATRPETVGYWLFKDRAARGLTPAGQAAALGVPLAVLGGLAVCRAPRPESFAADLDAIAAAANVDPAALGELLNAAQTAEAWAAPPAAGAGVAAGQWMIAAHETGQAPPHSDFPAADPPDPPPGGGP